MFPVAPVTLKRSFAQWAMKLHGRVTINLPRFVTLLFSESRDKIYSGALAAQQKVPLRAQNDFGGREIAMDSRRQT